MLELTLLVLTLATGDSVPLYNNLGTYHHAISSRNAKTKAYFDQGLRLTYGFNHDEAIRAFREAARLDATCAICWWGVAYASGPNINMPMDSAANANATDALARALKLRQYATPREAGYIDALVARYGKNAGPKGDSAYVSAVDALVKRWPGDLDAVVLSAEARMLLRPWNYWTADGKPQPGTTRLVTLLDSVVKINPQHPGACHYYIHAMEAADAAKALPCAERLAGLMPGAGHMVHMPGHIYIRLGRWDDAINANKHALHADESYFEAEHPQGFYPIAYYPHNHAFLTFAAQMSGKGDLAIEHAKAEAASIPVEVAAAVPFVQTSLARPFLVLVQFGKWNDVLAMKDPPASVPIARAFAAYAKGEAHNALGHADVARKSLASLEQLAKQIPPDVGPADVAVDIAVHALRGDIAMRANDLSGAEKHFREALRIQKGMTYNEPPDWYYPMEHSLGAVLLKQNRKAEAAAVFRQDLKLYPNNYWSTAGLKAAQ